MSVTPTLNQKRSIGHISGLVLINAMIFQEILSEHENRVYPLKRILADEDMLPSFCEHWDFILKEINYYPIFHVAREILLNLTSSKDNIDAVTELAATAQRIVGMRAALRHDLMGRVYHRLLLEAKYLGTYYTSIPAATMLLKLALRPDVWPARWQNLDEVSKLRIVDLACGTGTLLMAAADAVTDNYIHHSVNKGLSVDLGRLNNVLAETVLHGYDVLPSAVHLTASTIALRAPEITFTKMNLVSLPLGGTKHSLGSLEFIKYEKVSEVTDLFGAVISEVEQMSGKKGRTEEVTIPKIDLCVMNPPFTRSVGGNLLFGSLPEKERTKMQKDLGEIVKRPTISANITAGLGSVFTATADLYLKNGGRIGLVLPKALISGVAWEPTRNLLKTKYSVEYLVASHDPERWNFSESTSLSEVLLVALKGAYPVEGQNLIAINLWRNPSTAFEALAVVNALKESPLDVTQSQGAIEIKLGDTKFAEAIAFPWDELKKENLWILPCAFAQSDLIRASFYLTKGSLWLPGRKKNKKIPICPLSNLGALGPDRRDIHDGFSLSESPTAYPAFWGHDAKAVHTIEQRPNKYLSPLHKAKKGRHLRKAQDLWPLAGRVLIAERLWLNTIRLAAVRLPKPVLSNVWWPFAFKKRFDSLENEKALILWLNSTPGLLTLLVHRVETRGAWVDFKKPILSDMPVLDLKALTREQKKALALAYAEVAKETLLPLPEMDGDPVRAKIDAVIAKVLNLPDFSILRELLAKEPVICLRHL